MADAAPTVDPEGNDPGWPAQATVHRFDELTGAGAVITDDGAVVPFDRAAWAGGRVRTMRVGQRMAVTIEDGPTVSAMTLVTFAR